MYGVTNIRNTISDILQSLNPLKTKRILLYLKTQFVPRSEHFPSVIRTNQFMLYKAKVGVCSEINTIHTNTVWVECKFLNVKTGGTSCNQQALQGCHLLPFLLCARCLFICLFPVDWLIPIFLTFCSGLNSAVVSYFLIS